MASDQFIMVHTPNEAEAFGCVFVRFISRVGVLVIYRHRCGPVSSSPAEIRADLELSSFTFLIIFCVEERADAGAGLFALPALLNRMLVVVVVALVHHGLQAQRNTLSAGGSLVGAGGSVSFSVGQIDHLVLTGTTGSVHQGLQQPYVIDITSGYEESTFALSYGVFPNPAADHLWLSIAGDTSKDLSYRLVDERGRILDSGDITTDMTSIPVYDLAMAVYILEVHNAQEVVKTFRIVKQ